MDSETLWIPAGALEALFWCLWGVGQTALATGIARRMVYGSLWAGPDRFLAHVRPWARRGDWARVEAACRARRGPFARFTTLFAMVRGHLEPHRERVLAAAIASQLAAVEKGARGLLLAGACSLTTGLVGAAVAYYHDAEGLRRSTAGVEVSRGVAVRRVAWPPVVGASVCLSCLGAYGLVRARLEALGCDLDLVQALLESWARSWAGGAPPWDRDGVPSHRQPLPPFSDN